MYHLMNTKRICILCTAGVETVEAAIEVNQADNVCFTIVVPQNIKNEIKRLLHSTEADVIHTDIDHFDFLNIIKENRIFNEYFDEIYILGSGQREWSDYVECVCIAHKMKHNKLLFFQNNDCCLIWENNPKHKLKNRFENFLYNSIYRIILCYTKFTSKICGYNW